MSLSVQAIEGRIKQYEEEIMKVVANHTGLTAALAELKQLLSVASEVVSVVDPAAAPAVSLIENVVSSVDSFISPTADNEVINP